MGPGSLHRACARRLARWLTHVLRPLTITDPHHRDRMVEVVRWFVGQFADVLYSRAVQEQLYKALMVGLRCRRNPPVCLATMLLLCSKVTVDQIALAEDKSGIPPAVAGTGLDLPTEECDSVLYVMDALQRPLAGSAEPYHVLPTTSLVLEGVYFHDPDFLPLLFKKMPNLRHIELQYNGTPKVLAALSKHCPQLESLCFLQPRMEISLLEKDVWPVLFGFPLPDDPTLPAGVLLKFERDEAFRKQFIFQFPNLKKLDLDDLYFEEEILHDVYILTLLLQPKITSFGKHTGLTRRIIAKYRQLRKIVNPDAGSELGIYLTKAKFVDSVYDDPSDADLELRYLKEIVPMFKSLKSVELQKSYWNENEVARFCNIFSEHVTAFSLSDLPLSEMVCLSSVSHLRLTFMRQYSFEHVHLLLDSCPNLRTLSIHPVFQEHVQQDDDDDDPLERFGEMMDEDREMFDNMMLEEDDEILDNMMMDVLVRGVGGLQMFPEGDQQPDGDQDPWDGGLGHEPAAARQIYVDRLNKMKYSVHNKLTTLRIASVFEAPKEPSEAFLASLLERVPNLRHLCLGMWMGALSHRRSHLTCAGNALVNVVTGPRRNKHLLANLEQLCCLPSGTEQSMCVSLVQLADALPALHTLVVPALDNFLLSPTLRYFQHTSIDIQHKCATDQVFSHWEPEH